MEERDLIPEIDPTLGLTDEQVQSRTPAGKPVYSGKSEKEIVLTHCFTFFNLIFVILAVMLIIGGSSPLNMGFLVVAVINTVIGIIQEIRAKRAVERLTLVAERPVAVIRNGTRQEISPEAIVKDDIAEFASGDTLPADGILRSGEMWVDESLLTGEADAVTKAPGDEVKSGSAILSGRGRVQFTAVGGDSFAAQLSREAQKKPRRKKVGNDALSGQADPFRGHRAGAGGHYPVLSGVLRPETGTGKQRGGHRRGAGGDDPRGAVSADLHRHGGVGGEAEPEKGAGAGHELHRDAGAGGCAVRGQNRHHHRAGYGSGECRSPGGRRPGISGSRPHRHVRRVGAGQRHWQGHS